MLGEPPPARCRRPAPPSRRSRAGPARRQCGRAANAERMASSEERRRRPDRRRDRSGDGVRAGRTERSSGQADRLGLTTNRLDKRFPSPGSDPIRRQLRAGSTINGLSKPFVALVFTQPTGGALRVASLKNRYVVVEHHQAVMARADWIIDLGPGAGFPQVTRPRRLPCRRTRWSAPQRWRWLRRGRS